jgi:hypothetical protein
LTRNAGNEHHREEYGNRSQRRGDDSRGDFGGAILCRLEYFLALLFLADDVFEHDD